MKKGGIGGANTQTGAVFEGKVDLITFLSKLEGYKCKLNPKSKGKSNWYDIYFEGKFIASSFEKHALYNYLETQGVKWKKILSKKLLPDDAVYVIKENTVFILEVKHQETQGSVDEKLQTCGFKLIQYKKLFSPLNYEVQYLYILNDWFKKPAYKDTLDYILHSNCGYYFNYMPLQKIGLPVPHK
ncbi:MAG: hypothetical protein DSY43_00075 [Gammaproteobacteria bacterium]|nr:MAG: hypothetical protein DSY43_00075 [Gammaproteobacteria bacterium]